MLRNKFLFWGERFIEKFGLLLAPLSIFYRFAVFLRNLLYDWKLLSIEKASCIVVSVGNVVAGGSGKTPFVQMLAARFSHRNVAILSRGYGGDEPLLLKQRVPKADVLVGKDRAKLAKNIQADLIILDDGLQHRKLHRDFEIILGERRGHFLPWGFLRDTPKRKGDAYFQVGGELEFEVERILDLEGREVASIRGWRVGIFCGIAKPDRFRKTVEALGAEILEEKYFADHEEANLSKLNPKLLWICTEKDRVKIGKTDLPIYFLQMKMVCKTPSFEKLIEKIDLAIDNRRL